jgi:Flp pilus assembly protein protease CpaA
MAVGLVFFCGILAAAALTDLASYRIPNLLPFLLAIGALVFACPDTGAETLARLLSLLVLGGSAFAGYMLRGLGGGDLKLLAAVACWIPWPELSLFVLALALAGIVQAVAILGIRQIASTAGEMEQRMPYAFSIAAAGAAWALL